MAHAAAGRRGLSSDESDDWFFHVGFHEVSGEFLRIAADLANHHHCFRLGIAIEEIERVDEVRSDDGISADADRGRLSDTALRKLVHGFVSQRARSRNDTDIAFFVNAAGHDANLAFTGRDDARTIRSDQT